MARTALDARDYQRAINLYQQAQHNFPGNNAVKIEYISTLLKAGKPKQAYQILKTQSFKKLQQPLYFHLLAQIYGALKQQAKSHRYMAEYYYAKGETQAAITQIKLAQQAKDQNYYLAAILDQRLTFFTNEEIERKSD